MRNERGFMLLSAVFLTLIVSIMAMILLNANSKVQQRNSTLYFTAVNLANEQFAILESGANISIPSEDKTSYNGVKENSEPIKFEVYPTLESENATYKRYKVTVKWNVGGKNETFESVKTIRSISENLD
jgi:hypothetical protein